MLLKMSLSSSFLLVVSLLFSTGFKTTDALLLRAALPIPLLAVSIARLGMARANILATETMTTPEPPACGFYRNDVLQTPPRAVDGELKCGYIQCRAGEIKGCDKVDCVDDGVSCSESTIIGAKTLNCDGDTACLESNVRSMQEGGTVNCRGDFSCTVASIGTNDGVPIDFDVNCLAPRSCGTDESGRTSIKTQGVVTCEHNDVSSDPACDKVDIEAKCLLCGKNGCGTDVNFTSIIDGTAGDPITISAGTVGGFGECSADDFCSNGFELTNCQVGVLLEEDIALVSAKVDSLDAKLDAVKEELLQTIMDMLADDKEKSKKKDKQRVRGL